MRAPDIGRLAADVLFDPVESGDACQQVGGERGWACLVALEDLAAEVRPAGDLLDAVALVQLLISGIAVGLEKAGERPQLALRMDAAAIRREPIPGERRGGGARCAVIDNIRPEPRLRSPALAGTSIGTGVSSVWSLAAFNPSPRIRLTMGSRRCAAWPAQPARVERSMSTPCAAIISAWR